MRHRVPRIIVVTVVALAFFGIGFTAIGQQVNKALHPNLAAAQEFIQRAINRLTDAQKANEFDLGGHAQKAKDLLDQAFVEIKQAAQAANAKQ